MDTNVPVSKKRKVRTQEKIESVEIGLSNQITNMDTKVPMGEKRKVRTQEKIKSVEIGLSNQITNMDTKVPVEKKRKVRTQEKIESVEIGQTEEQDYSVPVDKRRKLAARDKAEPDPFVLSKPELRRAEPQFVTAPQNVDTKENRNNPYVRFKKLVARVLKIGKNIDFGEIADDYMIQDEHIISKFIMMYLCTDAAKLKDLGAMDIIPEYKLTRLLTILELNIRVGVISVPTDEVKYTMISVDQLNLRRVRWDRVLGAADACFVCLNIMTSPNMLENVYLERIMDRVILYIIYHLSNTIFPCYDSGRQKRIVTVLYTKILKLVNLLSEILNIQILTDKSVLNASSMGISTFFIKNVGELQLTCLKLVTRIFAKYEDHRTLLLDDILASLARLGSTKPTLRTYMLKTGEHIQMFTALVLQLVQCVVAPEKKVKGKNHKEKEREENQQKVGDDIVGVKMEKAVAIASRVLKAFLSKCGSKTQGINYTPLFENFLQDLLCTLNKPEWPATVLLLCSLGDISIRVFANNGTDVPIPVILDFFGVVAARFRWDSVSSRYNLDYIDQMIRDIRQEDMIDNDEVQSKKETSEMTNDERTQFLQKILLDFLAANDESCTYATHFHITRWYADLVIKKTQLINDTKELANYGSRNRKAKISDDEEEDYEPKNIERENAQKFRIIEEKKKLLLSRMTPFQEGISSSSEKRVQVFQTVIDYTSAQLILQFLSSNTHFSPQFDQFFKVILLLLKKNSIAIRIKAVKCLTYIVEADPSVLEWNDFQISVHRLILDQSVRVREATLDLIGKFISKLPELLGKYYEIVSLRISDESVNVRKRVIKIFHNICIECPDFIKIPEICVKMSRRINDVEGIEKLVMEVFQNIWFTPTMNENDLLRKVTHITDAVASNLEEVEQLLLCVFKHIEVENDPTKINTKAAKRTFNILAACEQIVDYLIDHIPRLEEQDTSRSSSSERLLPCVSTLLGFAKIRAQLLIKHASTLQPYLGLKSSGDNETKIICCVAKMLELVVPLMEHPSDSFLDQLENDTVMLINKNRPIMESCLSCLASITNKVTHNFRLIQNFFTRFNTIIVNFKANSESGNLEYINATQDINALFQAVFVVGSLIRHFDFTNPEVLGDLPPDSVDQACRNILYFLEIEDVQWQYNIFQAVGEICIRHNEFMLYPELKKFYHRMLITEDASTSIKVAILLNIKSYLTEDENRIIQQDLEWSKSAKQVSLADMNDVSSDVALRVIQEYLQDIMECYLHTSWMVRQPVCQVIQLVWKQGLAHPIQYIPCLISMSTDPAKYISQSAAKTLSEIEIQHPGYIISKAPSGIEMSHRLQKIIHNNPTIRGFIVRENGEYPVSINLSFYSLLRNSRPLRRGLIVRILKDFVEQARFSLPCMLCLADNLAFFPYQVQDEALFIVNHIDSVVSISGTNLLQSFREGLIPDQNRIVDSENREFNNAVSALHEDDDEEALIVRLPENVNHLQACLIAVQGCILLLELKQHIKDTFKLSDTKIQLYSSTEDVKVYEKAMPRKSNALFNPKTTLQKLKEATPPDYLDEHGRRDLIRQYLDFKRLMLQFDPADEGGADSCPSKLKFRSG